MLLNSQVFRITVTQLTIRSPCRLHLSLIDLNGALGRIDGGFGFAIEEPCVVMSAHDRAPGIHLKVPSSLKPEIMSVLTSITDHYDKSINSFTLTLDKSYPAHIGLGSKTQILMCAGRLVLQFLEEDFDHYELCKLIRRGGTSGIGYVTFRYGGFVLDVGHEFGVGKEKETFLPSSASHANPALTLFRANMPENWVILLTTLDVKPGAYAQEEVNIFQQYCPIPRSEVESICHYLMFMLLPSLINEDLTSFGQALNEIQNQGFKRVEISLVHPKVQELLGFLKTWNVPSSGLSSFGPTVFTIFSSKEEALQIKEAIQAEFNGYEPEFILTRPNNRGYEFLRACQR